MPTGPRSRNMDLIRWLNGGHKATAKKLSSLTNASYVSKMATGDMKINDYVARKIESRFELPHGWMDRENVTLLHLPNSDFELHQRIAMLPEAAKASLREFLSALKT